MKERHSRALGACERFEAPQRLLALSQRQISGERTFWRAPTMIKYGTVYYLLAAMLLVRSSLLNVHTVSYFFVNKPNDVGNCLVFQLE